MLVFWDADYLWLVGLKLRKKSGVRILMKMLAGRDIDQGLYYSFNGFIKNEKK